MALLLLVALILGIALPVGLVKRPGPAPPTFTLQPQLVAATASSLDFAVAVSKAAVVHYVLLPRTSESGTAWSKFSSRDVQAAAAGAGGSPFQVRSEALALCWNGGLDAKAP